MSHEPTDIDTGIVAFTAGVLLVGGALMAVVVWFVMVAFNTTSRQGAREFPMAAAIQNQLPPEPRLQTNPRGDLMELRAREDAILNAYGWIDANAGIVRIPIDAAMKLTVERGLPVRATKP